MGQSKVRLARHHHNAVLRQNIVAELYKQGYNYREIREEVMKRLDIPRYSLQTVHADVQSILAEWRQMRNLNVEELQQLELQRIDTIIKEASNCIFNSLFYDSIGKPDSEDVVLEKVRWRYRYDNTNKQNLCETFNYDPETDSIVKPESVCVPGTMKLSDLIGLIESWHDDMMDFCIEDVFSWRGSYDKPCCSLSTRQVSKVENLKELRRLLRFSFDGYKGGTYTYELDDEVHFESDYGSYTDGVYIKTFVDKNRDSEIVKHIFQHLR